jgi:dephospho-CoA kinase
MEIENLFGDLKSERVMKPIFPKHLRIGVVGKMCSGKTTLSNYIKAYLREKYNIEMKSLTFAGKVYDIAYDLFDMSREKKDRKLLQQIGSMMRQIDKDIWIKYVMKQAKGKDVMVEDCRYRNEFEALCEDGFLMIKINIDEEYQAERLKKTYPDTYEQHLANLTHASEMDIDGLEEEKCAMVLNARDNEHNFEIVKDFLDQYVEKHHLKKEKRAICIASTVGQYEYT